MRIYYSVQNGGDGSAYPKFFENELISEMDQSFEEEWGEPCTGFIEVEGDNLKVVSKIITVADYIEQLKEMNYADDDEIAENEDDGLDEVGCVHDDNAVTLCKRYIRMLTT